MKAMKKRRCIIDAIKAFIFKNRDLKRYKKAGYKVCNYTDYKLWQMYCYATGEAIDELLNFKKM